MSFSKNQTSTIKYHTCFIFLPVGIVKSHVTNHPTGVRRVAAGLCHVAGHLRTRAKQHI